MIYFTTNHNQPIIFSVRNYNECGCSRGGKKYWDVYLFSNQMSKWEPDCENTTSPGLFSKSEKFSHSICSLIKTLGVYLGVKEQTERWSDSFTCGSVLLFLNRLLCGCSAWCKGLPPEWNPLTGNTNKGEKERLRKTERKMCQVYWADRGGIFLSLSGEGNKCLTWP